MCTSTMSWTSCRASPCRGAARPTTWPVASRPGTHNGCNGWRSRPGAAWTWPRRRPCSSFHRSGWSGCATSSAGSRAPCPGRWRFSNDGQERNDLQRRYVFMNPIEQFQDERRARLQSYAQDSDFSALSRDWLQASMQRQYVYNFDWLGRPIIQYPQDMVAMQELVWRVRPDLIIETGIAHGGSLVLSASLLAMLDMCDAIEAGTVFDPRQSQRKVLGIDIDIRPHNRAAIEAHPMASRIAMVQGSAIASDVVAQVQAFAKDYRRVMVCLDSMHTHAHVLAELEAYAPLVTPGSYCVVFDTFVDDMPPGFFVDRPWDVGDNPKTAVWQWLPSHPEFEIDAEMENRLQATVAARGGRGGAFPDNRCVPGAHGGCAGFSLATA